MQTLTPEWLQYFLFEESFNPHLYTCTQGYPTVGIGKNLLTNPLTVEEQKRLQISNCALLEGSANLTFSQAEWLWEEDMKRCFRDLEEFDFWRRADFTPGRKVALASMRYQLGQREFLRFGPTIEHLNQGEYESAADHIAASLAARQTPNRYQRIVSAVRTGIMLFDKSGRI